MKFRLKRKRKCYIAYTVDVDNYFTVPIGFHLFEMLGLNERVFIEFFRMTDKYFHLDKIKEFGYNLETKLNREDVRYLAFNGKYNHEEITSIINLKDFDCAQDITCYWGYEMEEIIRDAVNRPINGAYIEKGLIKVHAWIAVDTINLEFDPDYYLENQTRIEEVLKEFEDIYKGKAYDKYVKIAL